MSIKASLAVALLALATCLTMMAAAKTGDGKADEKDSAAVTATTHATQDDPMRLEGEKRFHSNCGRCHAAPPKFPSRMMGTIIRHMRVRATLSDEDMHLILHYMTR